MTPKQEAIYKVTLKLVSEQGFQNAPMSLIAKKANVGVGTIYRYFPNKEELINALYIDIKRRMTDRVIKHYSSQMPVRDGFHHLIKESVLYFRAHSDELSFTEQYENSPLITSETHEVSSRMAQPFTDLFSRAKEENLLKDLPFSTLGALIGGASVGLAKHCVQNDALDGQAISVAIDAIWDMVAK